VLDRVSARYEGAKNGDAMYQVPAERWQINQYVIRLAKMANQVGDAIGSAWITVAGLVAVAGVVGAGGFALKSSIDIAELTTQQTYMQRDLSEVRSDIRDIKRGLDERRQGSVPDR